MTESTCPVCGDGFTTETGVRDHAWDVHDACHCCGERFDEQEALYTHWLELHDAELDEESRKRAETTVGDRTVCPTCGSRFAGRDAVGDHAWDAHGDCHICGDHFDEERSLHAHRLAVHEDELSRSARQQAAATVGSLSFRERVTHQGPVEAVSSISISRRALLGGGATTSAAVLGGAVVTGALGGGGDESLETHPAAASLGDQPTLGPTPGTAEGTIIAFEDPSCPSCARFELNTFPELKSRLIDTGDVSFVARSIPVVNPWGEPATLALEATRARDEAAFWGLNRYYYRNQSRITSDNVYRATRSYLTEQTDLDADGVIQDAEQGTHSEAVRTNLDVADRAGVRGTPTFFVFESGSFTTSFVGPQSYGVFANTLGV